LTAAAVLPGLAGLVAEGALVARVAQAAAAGRVAAAVLQVAVAPPVAARPPPDGLAVAHTGALVARRQVAVARGGTLEPPVAPPALTAARQLVAAGPRRAAGDALARLGAGGRPPALVAAAVAVDRVAAAVPGALAGVLAERAPAVGVAGALAGDGVTLAVGVARTHPAAVWGPELRGAAWWSRRTHIILLLIYTTLLNHWSLSFIFIYFYFYLIYFNLLIFILYLFLFILICESKHTFLLLRNSRVLQ